MRALAHDKGSVSRWLVGVAGLAFFGWLVWFFAAKVTVVAKSEAGRVEVNQLAYGIDAPVAGRVVKLAAELGAPVKAGDVVFELDSEVDQRLRVEEQARLEGLEKEIAAMTLAVAGQEQVLRERMNVTAATVGEGEARALERHISASHAEEEARRAAALRESGAISEAEARRLRASAREVRAGSTALRLGAKRVAGEQKLQVSELQTRVDEMRRELAGLEGKRGISRAQLAVLDARIARTVVRAPVAGIVGEVARVTVGAHVTEGQRVATVVPPGKLKAVGQFAPAVALGRVRPGQKARLRLDSYPWAEFGVVNATVKEVASEPRDGRVNVELEVDVASNARVHLEHGLTSSVEVDVERLSPARLVLRAAGRAIESGPPPAPPKPAPSAPGAV